jgi:hypothetical protein
MTFRFSPLGTFKTLEHWALIENEETLQQRIVDTCRAIRNSPGTFENLRQSTISFHVCTDKGGGHLSNLTKEAGAVAEILCLDSHKTKSCLKQDTVGINWYEFSALRHSGTVQSPRVRSADKPPYTLAMIS